MKKLVFVLLILIFIFSACTPATTEVVLSTTSTISPTVTYTSTPNITPLPTIPTFTPTFDVSTLVTVTPAERAECIKVDETLSINLGFEEENACIKSARANDRDPFECLNKNLYNEILEYLNLGGDINNVISQLDKEYQNYGSSYYFNYIDVTGDEQLELLIRNTKSIFGASGYFIYTCTSGKYSITYDSQMDQGVDIYSIQDINLNGIPEVLFLIQNTVLIVIEWNENSFIEQLAIRDFGESQYQIRDTNNDGLPEIILSRGYPPNWNESEEFPWRPYTSIYAWNGLSYILKLKEFEYPNYQFQAIQDADNYVNNGINEKAYFYYQDAISNENLEWWSPERRDFLISTLHNPNPPTASPSLQLDPVEYPSLASYAYYRIMLLQFVQGQETEANQTYQTLQDTFGNDIHAKPYIEMTTEFLQVYQVNQSMYDGCAAAIQYAVEHLEILIPLGSDYHGSQSKIYKPEDVCPFR